MNKTTRIYMDNRKRIVICIIYRNSISIEISFINISTICSSFNIKTFIKINLNI